MWELVTVVKLFSFRQYIKHVQLIRCCSVSAIIQLWPISLDFELEESSLNSKQTDQINSGSLELNTREVVERPNGLGKEPKIAISYFEQLKLFGFSYNVNMFVAIVRI